MSALRLLFVSWSTVGGSGQSQRQLAARLAAHGHDVRFVVHDRRPARATRFTYERLSDLSVRLDGRGPGRVVEQLRDLPGRRTLRGDVDGLPHLWSPVPENALAPALDSFRPHMVVVSSVDRWAWRRIHALCRARGVPAALYIREEASLEHLAKGSVPSLLLSNTPSLAASLSERGHPCACVPSVVDLRATATVSTRRTVLAINPIRIKGADLIWDLVQRLPEISFVLQEVSTLGEEETHALRVRAGSHANVHVRRATPPGPSLYGDARILLTPYLVDSRPRVVLEAQANGIPVVASDVPSLVDAVGAGGLTLPLDDVDSWVDAIRTLWHDEERYAELAAAARTHAARPEVDPDTLALQFEELVRGTLDAEGVRP